MFTRSNTIKPKSSPLQIVGIYIVVSALWILITDLLLAKAIPTPVVAIQLQTLKAWIFISITSAMLYKLIQRSEMSARSSETQLKTVLDSMADALLIVDARLRVVAVNRAALSLFGVQNKEELHAPVEEIANRFQLRALTGELIGKESFIAVRALRGEPVTNYDAAIRRADGVDAIVNVSAAAVKERNSSFVNFAVITVRNITTHKQAVEALQESEERLRTLINSTPDPIFFKDAEGRWLEVNKAVLDLFGLVGVDYRGKTDLEISKLAPNYKDVLNSCKTIHEPAWQRRTLNRVEYVVPHPDGTQAVFDVIGVPLFYPDGRRKALVVLGRDITERKHAEQEQQKLIARYKTLSDHCQRQASELHAILNSMVDAVFVCDAQKHITLANNAAMNMLGLKDLNSKSDAFIDSPELLRTRHYNGQPIAREDLPLVRALAGETVIDDDETIFLPDIQKDVDLKVTAAPIRGRGGKITAAVSVSRDITELTELDRLKDQFIRVAAHELKTPITIMKGYSQALLQRSEVLSAPQQKMLIAIDLGADRIDRIVGDLLDISQLHLGYMALHLEKLNLSLVVSEVVDRVALTTSKHTISLLESDSVVIQGDHERLIQVVKALLDNAIKYSPNGGEIEVSVKKLDREAVVAVRDHGVGIPDTKQKRIFERFYRAHTDTPFDYGGMGVGLYLAKEIINRHHGRIWFESRENNGSSFYFSLPLGRS